MVLGSPKQNYCAKTLTIHILGADGVECSSEELVRKSVGSFVRWMDAALRSGALSHAKDGQEGMATGISTSDQFTNINSLLIEFSGPNMPNILIGKVMDLLPESKSKSDGLGLVSAKAIFQQREYHEVVDDTVGGLSVTPADICLAFNAGIWGYDSWKPTLSHMCSKVVEGEGDESTVANNLGIGRTLFVITAYTVEECEDDAEVVAEVVEAVGAERSPSTKSVRTVARQLWAPQSNPFSSRLERKTASAPPGRKYYENGAWQAWDL